MQPVGNYNKISKELADSIPPLKDTVVFQLTTGVPNPDPDPDQKLKLPMLYGKKQLLTQFRIKDPFSKALVDVVLAEDWTPENRPTKSKCFVAGHGEVLYNGTFALQEGNVEHEELYEVLMISPEREGTPCEDRNIPKIFKLLSSKNESKNTNIRIDNLRRALDRASKMEEAEGRDFAAALNKDYLKDWTELHTDIKEYARQNVDEFLRRSDDKKTSSMATLKRAFDANILAIDPATDVVTMGKQIITTLAKREGFDLLADLQAWFDSATNGEQVFKGIEKSLKGK